MAVEACARSLALLLLLSLAAPPASADPEEWVVAYAGGNLPVGGVSFCVRAAYVGEVDPESDACEPGEHARFHPGPLDIVRELVVGFIILGTEVCVMVDDNGAVQACKGVCLRSVPVAWCAGGGAYLP